MQATHGKFSEAQADSHADWRVQPNIKPSNILRCPQQHDWILSDLACAAALGASPLSQCVHILNLFLATGKIRMGKYIFKNSVLAAVIFNVHNERFSP